MLEGWEQLLDVNNDVFIHRFGPPNLKWMKAHMPPTLSNFMLIICFKKLDIRQENVTVYSRWCYTVRETEDDTNFLTVQVFLGCMRSAAEVWLKWSFSFCFYPFIFALFYIHKLWFWMTFKCSALPYLHEELDSLFYVLVFQMRRLLACTASCMWSSTLPKDSRSQPVSWPEMALFFSPHLCAHSGSASSHT